MWVTKLLISPVKERMFCPRTTKFGPKLAFLCIAGLFGALLVGWLVVVARKLYLETHLFTKLIYIKCMIFSCMYILPIKTTNTLDLWEVILTKTKNIT